MTVLIVALATAPHIVGADARPFDLNPTFARDERVCRALFASPAALEGCRAYDVRCPTKTDFSVQTGPLDANGFVEHNAYGFSELHLLFKPEEAEEARALDQNDPVSVRIESLASALPKGKAVLFVSRFDGDNHPRLLEMWTVDYSSLKDVMSISLPPKNPKAMSDTRERNAELLRDVLKRSEKLASEWSPLIAFGGEVFLVERECIGRWAYGGNYACDRITKLRFKRIEHGKPTLYCELSAR